MKRHVIFIFALTVLFCVTTAQAAERPWPQTAEALSRWQGEKQVTLRTDAPDPFASETVRGLLEMLLAEGYAVRTVRVDAKVDKGLILDYRTAGATPVLILSAAADGSILAMDRIGAAASGELPPPEPATPLAGMAVKPAPAPVRKAAGAEKADSGGTMISAPIELAGHPRGLATMGKGEEGTDRIVLLFDNRLEAIRLGAQGPEKVGICSSPVEGSRALHVDAGDLDGDGESEAVAVWAEDLRDIYQGTDSRVHAWVLDPTDQNADCRKSGDLSGYVRLIAGTAFWQEKGVHEPFTGKVRRLLEEDGGYRPGPAVPWAGRDLYAATPVSPDRALAWTESGKLNLVDRGTGKTVVGGTLLADLGTFEGSAVASRLESPEFRSGFSREDRILEKYYPLPRRMAVAGDGSIYTISRHRSGKVPFWASPSGSDTLVRIGLGGDHLSLERPFPEVDVYLIDFALIEREGSASTAVLLLNEKEDGSGKAYLLLQEAG